MNELLGGLSLPHIRYLRDPQSVEKLFYYLGGESEENHKRLKVGQLYLLRTALYAETQNDERVQVWICMDSNVNICRINPKNFGNFADLRNIKIEKVLDGTDLS